MKPLRRNKKTRCECGKIRLALNAAPPRERELKRGDFQAYIGGPA